VRYQTAERLAEAFGDALQVARGAETLPSQPALAPPAGRVRVVPGVSEEVLPGPLPELPPATQPARARWRGRDRAFGELARRLVPWRLRLPALRRRLIAAPVLAVALLYAASQLAAAPRARTSHPPHASGVKRAVASAGTHLTTAAKAPTPPAHRRVTPHQRTRPHTSKRARVIHTAASPARSSTGAAAQTYPSNTSTDSSYTASPVSTSNPPPSSASGSSASAASVGGPSGSAPFGPGYPAGG
jgi:hypothetical protein